MANRFGGSSIAIECNALEKHYPSGAARRVRAIAGVTLRIHLGERVILHGPSGCGKSTLLSLFGGIITPTSGELWVLGYPLHRLREHHRAHLRRRLVGFIFQDLALVPGMSVEENILLPLLPDGGPTADHLVRLEQWLKHFDFSHLRNVPVNELSGGERQRVALIRSLMNDPPLLLFDEPTAHLDSGNTEQLIQALTQLFEGAPEAKARSLIISTHDPRLIDTPLATRVITLSDGQVAGDELRRTRPAL
ncbi:MAG: ABC transporter ATP-binding protein [Sandaracinaceae bacterium]|nr:ABC transporter ATP-binding protein [Sandaracinaceae bacterium]MDW8246921.1 ABC transporter ATP-binding protein [Sandaracinaceae bacterium]